MSGIAAVWRLDGAPLDRTTLDRVTERLAPLASDAVGAWLDGPVGLGHRMLHTVPQSLHEKLPIVGDAGDVVVTADARLDNRDELIPALGLAHRVTDGIGDEKLILHAWERWGEECPMHLLGDFALALWDARRRVLFCARDPAGVRPLYYHLGPRLFAVASEVKALLAIPGIPRQLDEVRIAAFLVPDLDDRAATFYESVRRLPAGHSLTVGAQGGVPRAYWQLDPTRELHYGSDAAYGEAFRELFTDAVRCRLRSAFPIAAALSGGLDSSSVVCVARALREEARAEPLWTYTARFPTIPRCDEDAYVSAVEAQGGLVSRHLRADTLDPLGDLDRAPHPEEETLHAPGYYMHRTLYHAARADGARVFLEGMGGDRVVSHGMGYLHDLARHGRWLALGREARELARAFQRPTWRTLRTVASGVASPPLRRAWRRLRHGGALWPPLIRAEFAQRIGLANRLRAAEPPPARGDTEGARHEHWRQITSGRFVAVLETLAAAAGAAGVEVRDPFLDRRLMEFCLALPVSQKIRQGRTRVVVRHALGALLPREIRERPGKAPLDLMLSAALATYGRDRLGRLLDEARSILGPYVRPDAIERAYRQYLKHGRPRDVHSVWQLATATLWLRRAAR